MIVNQEENKIFKTLYLYLKKSILFYLSIFFILFCFVLFNNNSLKKAYAGGFMFSINTPNINFSIGSGVNAFFSPSYENYIYSANGMYYMWASNNWYYGLYSEGPWYPLSPSYAYMLPGPFAYGPPMLPPGQPGPPPPPPPGPGPQPFGPPGPGPQGPPPPPSGGPGHPGP